MFRFPRDHVVFIRSQILAFALLAYSSHAEFEDSCVVKCSLGTHNYSLSQFHSIKNPFPPEPVCPPFLKIITFVLSRFTVSPEICKLFLDCLSGFSDVMAGRILENYRLRIMKGISSGGLVVIEFRTFHCFEHTQLLPISGERK